MECVCVTAAENCFFSAADTKCFWLIEVVLEWSNVVQRSFRCLSLQYLKFKRLVGLTILRAAPEMFFLVVFQLTRLIFHLLAGSSGNGELMGGQQSRVNDAVHGGSRRGCNDDSSLSGCQDNNSYIWRSGSPCCESALASSDMERRPSSVETFLSHIHRPQDPSRWSSRGVHAA
uniref:Ion_trans domain-containing protein n=1 Tax=Syphacia muris TaxID=451379 RepID=A0A0N5B0K4_9BILA